MTTPEKITSRDNAKLKLARRVRDGKEPGLMFIEGVRVAEEAVRSGVVVHETLLNEDQLANDRIASVFAAYAGAVTVTPKAFDSIADTGNSQGIVLIAERPQLSGDRLGEAGNLGLAVYLDRVNNPSNLGAVVRTAEAAGVRLLITSPGSADAFSPRSIRASMGSCFRLPIAESVPFDEAVRWAKGNGSKTTAADTRGAEAYTEVDWSESRLLIFGSEAHGLEERMLDAVDERIFIPMEPGVESLNLAVSAGIILFEAKRSRESGAA